MALAATARTDALYEDLNASPAQVRELCGLLPPSSKLTPVRLARLCSFLRTGISRRDAAVLSGIGKDTIEEWMSFGRKDRMEGLDTAFALLVEEVEYAEASISAQLTVKVASEATKETADGRLALEMLKHRFPEEWNPRFKEAQQQSRVDVTVQIANMLGGVTQADVHSITSNVGYRANPEDRGPGTDACRAEIGSGETVVGLDPAQPGAERLLPGRVEGEDGGVWEAMGEE